MTTSATTLTTTLAASPLSALLARLFTEAEATGAALQRDMDRLSPDEQRDLMLSQTDYRAFYGRAKNYHLAVSRDVASLLYMLARATRARTIIEFGTSFGVSTLHLAAALRDNGGGRLISTEFEPTKVARARATVAEAGLSDLVEIREGDALDTLARDLPLSIDLVLLDGAKGLYPAILSLVEARLRTGALVVADNADWSAEYLARVRSPGGGYLSIALAEDLEVSMRVGATG